MDNYCECGNKLHWEYTHEIVGGVPQNRLNTNDIRTIFWQSCEVCGEDGKTISIENALEILNRAGI